MVFSTAGLVKRRLARGVRTTGNEDEARAMDGAASKPAAAMDVFKRNCRRFMPSFKPGMGVLPK